MTVELKIVEIDYTNWRGERRWRMILPSDLRFENNEWHPDTQWMLYATDVEDGKLKGFTLSGIHSFGRKSS